MDKARSSNTEEMQALLCRCQKGDVMAFRAVVEWNQHYAYALAFRLLMNTEDAEPAGPEYTFNDKNVVEMPGLILDTNSEEVDGNRITWETGNAQYFVYDYEMWAESRMVNRWAVWVTGILFILIVAGLIVSFVRQRVMRREEPGA